jgi:hypothetical protein
VTDRAQVFISSGQTKGSDEEYTVERIRNRLEQMGYSPYVAIQEHTAKGLKDNIFRKLEDSEYFLFIDFKREKLEPGEYRGSLFTHQELALAVYLGKKLLVFQENGIKRTDGILGSIQANSIPFSDRQHLHVIIAEEIENSDDWEPDWKEKLVIERPNEKESMDVTMISGSKPMGVNGPCRWYHITVKNRHNSKMAVDCVAYLRRSKNKSTNEPPKEYEPIELKWQGTTTPRSVIPSNFHRNFDALIIPHDKPNVAYFGLIWSAVDFSPPHNDRYSVKGPGDFELDYLVHSFNFPSEESKFFLHLGDKIEDVKFYRII